MGSQTQAAGEVNAGLQAAGAPGRDAARGQAPVGAQVAHELATGSRMQIAGKSAAPASLEASADRPLPVAERFVSVNGEGRAAGKLAAFIRFTGCNLACSYCDTMWANAPVAADRAERVSVADLPCLVRALLAEPGPLGRGLRVEIETNGAADLCELARLREECASLPGSLTFTVDWKLPSSGMEDRMLRENFALLDARDTVKFVCGGEGDLVRMLEVSRELGLPNRVPVNLSPVSGRLDPARIVDFMQDNNLTWATAQLQLHKIIWPGVEKGV